MGKPLPVRHDKSDPTCPLEQGDPFPSVTISSARDYYRKSREIAKENRQNKHLIRTYRYWKWKFNKLKSS